MNFFKRGCCWILLGLSCIFLAACGEESSESPTLLVGTYRVIDQNIPFPFLIERDKDSTFLINHRNEIIDRAVSKASPYIAGDTLQMKTHSFFFIVDEPGFFVFDQKDSLNFPYAHYKYGARLKEASVESLPALEEVKEKLSRHLYSGRITSSTPNRDMEIEKHWKFSGDSLTTVFSYYYEDHLLYQEQQTKKYHLFERQGMLFFSENEVPENPQMLYQIVDFSTDSFTIQYDRNSETIKEIYEIAEQSALPVEVQAFSKCLDGQPGEYYHGPDVTYLKGNDFLIEKIGANAPADTGNGYITVHFTVNCRGQVGRLGLEQMDRSFKSTSFSPALVEHIVSEVVKLRDWPEVPPSYIFRDVHAFLMFKIENGEITDLCP